MSLAQRELGNTFRKDNETNMSNKHIEIIRFDNAKIHIKEYLNGEQKRDFIYVKDLIDVLLFFMEGRTNSGLYNLGTGKARTFKDLALSVFKAMKINPDIEYIPIPEDIRQAYQYFTEASMTKLKDAGYEGSFTPLEEATEDYINYYLKEKFL